MFPRDKIVFLFSLLVISGYSQEVKTLYSSGFKHNYVVGKLEYIEDIKDTARLKHIATLQIEDKTYHWTGIVIHWLDRFQTESKKLGANSFCIDKYENKDSVATLSIKVFFASISFLQENETKRNKNNIVCFSSFTDLVIDSFYLNKIKQDINPEKFYSLNAEPGKEYNLSVNRSIAPQKVKFKDEKRPSKYFIAPYKKGTITTFNTVTNPSSVLGKISKPPHKNERVIIIMPANAVGFAAMGIGILASLKGNKMIELDYKDGRFMTDIFK